MLNFFTNFLGEAYESSGLSRGKSTKVLSLLSTKNQTLGGGVESRLSGLLGSNNSQLKSLLKSFPLTRTLIGIYSSTIKDILGKSPFKIKFTSEENKVIQNQVNEFLSDVKLKEFLLTTMDDALYEGSSSKYIENLDHKWKSYPLKSPEKMVQVQSNGKIDWYKMDSSDDEDKRVGIYLKDRSPELIESDKILYYGFSLKSVKNITELENEVNKTKNIEVNFKNKYVVNFQYMIGTGILDGVLSLLFQYLLFWLMFFLISLKNATRPDIMMARIGDTEESEDITQIAEGLREVEAMLNNGTISTTLTFADPWTIIQLLYNAFINSVKVVPSIMNYTEMEKLEYPDLENKLMSLRNSLEEAKRNLMNALGIPDELLSGQSNRWEVVSRSSRFLTAINERLQDISRSVKDIVIIYVRKYFKKNLTYEDIDLPLDTTNIIFNNEFNSKQVLISDKIGSIARILSDSDSICSTGIVEKTRYYEWLKNQLRVLDPEISNYINLNLQNQEMMNQQYLQQYQQYQDGQQYPQREEKGGGENQQ